MEAVNSKINYESKLMKALDMITIFFYLINQILVSVVIVVDLSELYEYFSKQKLIRKQKLIHSYFNKARLVIFVICIILLSKFVVIGPKVFWKTTIILSTIINIILLLYSDLYSDGPLVGKTTSIVLLFLLLMIMLGIIYLYYIKQDSTLRSHSGHYFVFSNGVLILGVFITSIIGYFCKVACDCGKAACDFCKIACNNNTTKHT